MTREEAIRILDPEFVANEFAKYDEEHGIRDVEQIKAIYDACVMALAALREQQERRWIPVSERKPDLIPCGSGAEFSEAVMILTSGRKVMEAVWDGVCWTGPFGFWEAWGEKVTHWMKTPELPKEENNG